MPARPALARDRRRNQISRLTGETIGVQPFTRVGTRPAKRPGTVAGQLVTDRGVTFGRSLTSQTLRRSAVSPSPQGDGRMGCEPIRTKGHGTTSASDRLSRPVIRKDSHHGHPAQADVNGVREGSLHRYADQTVRALPRFIRRHTEANSAFLQPPSRAVCGAPQGVRPLAHLAGTSCVGPLLTEAAHGRRKASASEGPGFPAIVACLQSTMRRATPWRRTVSQPSGWS